MPKFVERNLEGNFYGRKEHGVVFDGNNFEAKKRERNRRMIARGQGIPMPSVGSFNEYTQERGETDFDTVNNRRERRTRGKEKRITISVLKIFL